MIYIHGIGSCNIEPKKRAIDIKADLKKLTGKVFRRTDRYIQLALLGAHKLAKRIDSDTALYMASGQGNLAVFNRLRDQQFIEHLPPRPVDFINSLSNTAGFYVAQYLGLSGKNLFLSHHGFPAETALLLAQNDLKLKKQQQILVGGVDELLEPESYTKKLLGICDSTALGEGSNWMLLNGSADNAIASLSNEPLEMSREEIQEFIRSSDELCSIAFGMRTKKSDIEYFMKNTKCRRFAYEPLCGYYETAAFFVLNSFIEREKGKLVFVDNFEDRYRVVNIEVFS